MFITVNTDDYKYRVNVENISHYKDAKGKCMLSLLVRSSESNITLRLKETVEEVDTLIEEARRVHSAIMRGQF